MRAGLHWGAEGSDSGPPASSSAKRENISGASGACFLHCLLREEFRVFSGSAHGQAGWPQF